MKRKKGRLWPIDQTSFNPGLPVGVKGKDSPRERGG